eukprot:CAMPEP_0117756066 /NCGR_PEP_ID=MMETSP0947-20121206/13832_1 /TAXON_ID=44440 /ORGANISM="Chattonella subsalsa, Strain CCMP2191" /LENGTH=242 /DNA_ID=CAMNT_0005575533 /DNA_START=71 /DNA_END=796 /DNA_ORIENTATION=+
MTIGMENEIHWLIATAMIVCAAATLAHELRGNAAPYGRYSPFKSNSSSQQTLKDDNENAPSVEIITKSQKKSAWGPLWNAKLCWVVMEIPNLVMACICWWLGEDDMKSGAANSILFGLFAFHYVNRSLVFPLRMRGGKPMPVGIMAMAFLFCCANGYLQCRYLCSFNLYPDSTLKSPHFIIGIGVFFTGFITNYHADHILRNLRKPGESGYKIPYGGLFNYVSGANFAGEILEWIGFAIAAW